MKSVGERIRQARNAKGISAETLAKMAGYKTQSGIANIENRPQGSGGHRLPMIAQALGVPVQWLLNGPDSDTVPFEEATGWAAHVAQPAPAQLAVSGWPFVMVTRARMEALMGRLTPQQASEALADMDRQLHRVLSDWESQSINTQGNSSLTKQLLSFPSTVESPRMPKIKNPQ